MPLRQSHKSIRSCHRNLVALLATVALATACGAPDDVAASTYDGLDAELVAEATENANFISRLEAQPDDTKSGLAQGMVINFAVCRQLFHAYEQLVTTGAADPLPALARPTNPESLSYDWWIKDHAAMSTAVQDRDIDAIRQWIAGEGSCGEWIPVEANTSETISDRVAALEVAP